MSRVRMCQLVLVLLCTTMRVHADESLPLVLSTIRPLHLIVLALAGDRVDAREFPGIGASPHDFVVRPSAIRLLESARVVFWIGPELERPLEATHHEDVGEVLLDHVFALLGLGDCARVVERPHHRLVAKARRAAAQCGDQRQQEHALHSKSSRSANARKGSVVSTT